MDGQRRERMRQAQRERRGAVIIDQTQGQTRNDGYSNMLNKYGTSQDNSMAYVYGQEPAISDMELARLYEGNGLFTKIIDRPSEEAVKHGLDIDYGDEQIAEYVEDNLDKLEFEEKFATAEKWARLYGGSIIVMLCDDGGALEDPLDMDNFTSIEEMRVFERAVVQEDCMGLYQFHFNDSMKEKRPFGQAEYYHVYSAYGYFTVHYSRCLVFRNGRLPEQTTNSVYRYWGIPEYVKINRALRECVTSHEDGVKLLERSVQAIYKMKNLAQLLSTDSGEDKVLQRLQVIDMARGILNSIAIDTDGEDYDYKSLPLSGVKDIIDATCNMLSAVTDIPQTILFGRSPAGMNATGESDLENYYNMVENIQKQNMKKNARTVIDLILKQGKAEGKISEIPKYKMKFAALWSLSESEQAAVDQQRVQIEQTKAQTAQIYIEAGVLDPSEVRKSLAKEGDFEIEEVISEDDIKPEDELDLPEDTFAPKEEEPPPKTKDDGHGLEIKAETMNADGGPGSGNFGHSGRPGKIGGSSAGSGKASGTTEERTKIEGYNSRISAAYKTGDAGNIRKEIKGCLDDAEVGMVLHVPRKNGTETTLTKTGIDRYLESDFGYQLGYDDVKAKLPTTDDNGVPEFEAPILSKRAQTTYDFQQPDSLKGGKPLSYTPGTNPIPVTAENMEGCKAGSVFDSGGLKFYCMEKNGKRTWMAEGSDIELDDLPGAVSIAKQNPNVKLYPGNGKNPDVYIPKDNGEAPGQVRAEHPLEMPGGQRYGGHDVSAAMSKRNSRNEYADEIGAERWRMENGFFSAQEYSNAGATSGAIKKASETGKGGKKLREKAEEIDFYCENAPTWNGGTLYRGIGSNQFEKQQILEMKQACDLGNAVTMHGIASWTSSKDTAEGYSDKGKGAIIICEGGTTWGTSIKQFSRYSEEDEVLVSSKATYKIARYYEEGGKTYFHVIEDNPRLSSNEKNADGGAGSGNWGHAGRPGKDGIIQAVRNDEVIGWVKTMDGSLKKRKDDDDNIQAASVLVISDGKILCGDRTDGKGICGPGGHIEEGETPEHAVIREAYEEFDIVPLNILPMGVYRDSTGLYDDTMLYLTDQYTCIPKADGGEMLNARWITLPELIEQDLFPPFRESIEIFLNKVVKPFTNTQMRDIIKKRETYNDDARGNWGHAGRQGKRGGSAPRVSPYGTNKACTGFRGERERQRHEKHWEEFGFTSNDEYEKAAIEFLRQPVGGDIEGYLREEDNAIIRFNTRTTEFAVGYPGAEVLSYYKAKWDREKKVERPDKAFEYFNYHMNREMKMDEEDTSQMPGLQEV